MDLLIFVISLLCLFFTLAFFSKPKTTTAGRLPPGPTPLPVIGNLLQLGDKPHQSLAKLAATYGPIMTLKLGQITTIVISSANLAKETLQTHDFNLSDRAVPDAIHAQDHHLSMEWFPVGPQWKKLKKIFNSHIFSAQRLDLTRDLRREKVQQLVADVQQSCRERTAVSIGQAAFRTTLNALSYNIFSVDLTDSSSERAREFKEVFRLIMDEVGKPNLSDYFPIVRKIDPQGIRRRTNVYFGKLMEIFDRIIDERMDLRKHRDYTPRNDALDILLTLNNEGNVNEMLDRESMKHLFVVIFVAGTDTTSSTLEWAMTELLRNPEALRKVQMELREVIGKGRVVDECDIARLPYLQAVVKETFRLHPPIPLLLPRKARENVEMCGFIVPKGAQIMVNAWAIGRDGNVWDDPNSFSPERFLESEIDLRGRNFELIPFGGGRRICPGLPLATRMLHMILGSLVNNFDWKIEQGLETEVLDMEDKFGITLEKAIPLRAIPVQYIA